MAEPIRYYMDQHFPGPVTDGLRRRGIDVLTAQEADRCGLPDSDQLAFATGEERVMVTFDSDYLVLHRTGTAHAGIRMVPAGKVRIRNAGPNARTLARRCRPRQHARLRRIPVRWRRHGTPKSGTDWRDLAVLLLAFPELKTELGPAPPAAGSRRRRVGDHRRVGNPRCAAHRGRTGRRRVLRLPSPADATGRPVPAKRPLAATPRARDHLSFRSLALPGPAGQAPNPAKQK